MPHSDLQPFIDAAKQRGASDEFLASALASRGWPSRDVQSALIHWWERSIGVALPARPSAAGNARDAFLYLLAFSMLAVWSSALGSLWFHLIEYWFPDPVVTRYVYGFRSLVTWQMASILVALPIYLWVMRLILRHTQTESGVRTWLTYIALLLAATGVVCDLVCFVDYFLKGELTLRFVLKCATVLVICGSILIYYFGFLRNRGHSGVFAMAAVLCAAVALVCGLTAAGTPRRSARSRRTIVAWRIYDRSRARSPLRAHCRRRSMPGRSATRSRNSRTGTSAGRILTMSCAPTSPRQARSTNRTKADSGRTAQAAHASPWTNHARCRGEFANFHA